MFSINGKRISGLGIAADTLGVQIPLIAREFTEINGCFIGTINIKLETPLLVLSPDFRTKRVVWEGDCSDGEVFDFLRIKLEINKKILNEPAWLYIAHDSPHREDLFSHEILAPKLDLDTVKKIIIHIDRAALQIPYNSFPILVVA